MENILPDEKLLPVEIIKDKIFFIRGKKVMLDKDLALLYGVPTKRLNEAVKRNIGRFPLDFMFQLVKKEAELFSRSQIVTLKPQKTDENLAKTFSRSQFATLKTGSGSNQKYLPFVFTEQGIAMLSSVLNSDKAIQINIQIIRIFIKLREMIDAYQDLREKVEEMEQNNETNFREIFRVIKLLIVKENKPKREIGF